jgi:hypothetical protein
MFNDDPLVTAKVIDLVLREREMALSAREWKHRLAGYGYAIKDTDHGQVVESLPKRIEIAVLPEEEEAVAVN